jgi:hypothetical protein
MSRTIQADETGALVVPAGLAPPGARFSVEPQGDDVILHRQTPDESAEAESVDAEAAAAKIAWLRSWIESLPPSPAIPLEATRRDSMYD